MFEECLSDEDYERLPDDYPIEVPNWLTPSKAETIYQQIKEYKDRQRTRVSLVRTFDSMAHKVVQYSAQDKLFWMHNIEVEQLNHVMKSILSLRMRQEEEMAEQKQRGGATQGQDIVDGEEGEEQNSEDIEMRIILNSIANGPLSPTRINQEEM